MQTKVIKLNKDYLHEFIQYCITHGKAHDDSFLEDEDLDNFAIGDENPTYLLIEDGVISGVLSLMIDDYFLKGRKSRVRIFHCLKEDLSFYEMLLKACLPINADIDHIEMFIPAKLNGIKSIIENLSFDYYRSSFIMTRTNKSNFDILFDDGYNVIPFREGIDEVHYARVRNSAFKNIKGSETPITNEMVLKQFKAESLLKDGMQILWFKERPIGIIRMVSSEEEGKMYSFVMPLAIEPEFHGKGLGTKLLKYGINLGFENGIEDSMLVVNAENKDALSLYLKVGYEIEVDFECYRMLI